MSGDPYRYFRVEARELIARLAAGALELERGAASADLVARLLRATHTLKGAARVVRQSEIARLAHEIEDAIVPLRDAASTASTEIVDAILRRTDGMTALLGTLDVLVDEPAHAVRTDLAAVDAIADSAEAASGRLGTLRRAVGALDVARRLSDLVAESLPESGRDRARAEELRTVIRGLERALDDGLDRAERDLAGIREAADALRLAAARTLFASLERAARDGARLANRRVTFEARGGDVRLDAHVLAALERALVQLARNAVAHGIEPETERIELGKPAAGNVALDVVPRGRDVAFVFSDDGRGIDMDAVRRAARAKALVPTDVGEPDDAWLVDRLLRGGLSTAADVDELSGRGVGLDVVRDVVTKLGGDVSVRSERGRGTTVELVVPARRRPCGAPATDSDLEIVGPVSENATGSP